MTQIPKPKQIPYQQFPKLKHGKLEIEIFLLFGTWDLGFNLAGVHGSRNLRTHFL